MLVRQNHRHPAVLRRGEGSRRHRRPPRGDGPARRARGGQGGRHTAPGLRRGRCRRGALTAPRPPGPGLRYLFRFWLGKLSWPGKVKPLMLELLSDARCLFVVSEDSTLAGEQVEAPTMTTAEAIDHAVAAHARWKRHLQEAIDTGRSDWRLEDALVGRPRHSSFVTFVVVAVPRPHLDRQPGHALPEFDPKAISGLAEEGQGHLGPGLDQSGQFPRRGAQSWPRPTSSCAWRNRRHVVVSWCCSRPGN